MAEKGGIIDGLFVKLGYDYDAEQMKKFDEGVKNTNRLLKNTALTAVGLAVAFGAVFKVLSSGQRDLQRNAILLNTEADTLEGVMRISEQLTGQRQAATATLGKFAEARRKLLVGEAPEEGLLRAFGRLNVTLNDLKNLKSDEILFKINRAMQSLSSGQQEQIAQLLGFPEYIDFLTEANLQQQVLAQNIRRDRSGFVKLERTVTRLKQGVSDLFLNLGKDQVDEIVKLLEYVINTVLPAIARYVAIIATSINEVTKDFENQRGLLYDLLQLFKGIASAIGTTVDALRGVSDNKLLNFLGKVTTAPVRTLSKASETVGGAAFETQRLLEGADLNKLLTFMAPLASLTGAFDNLPGSTNTTTSQVTTQNDVVMYISNEDPQQVAREVNKVLNSNERRVYGQTINPVAN